MMTAPVIIANEPKIVKIGFGKLCSAIFMTLISIGVVSFYTRVYIQASVNNQNTTLYIWFLVHIGFFWCGVLIHLIEILNILEYYGQFVFESVWRTLQYMNTYPCRILKFSHWGVLVTGCYFLPHWGCGDYKGTNTCIANRMIAVSAGGLLLLLLICGYCYFCVNQNRASSNIVNYGVNMFVPIYLPSSDTTCPICRRIVTENDSAGWTSLTCDHTFHARCISEWVKYKSTCPLCRAIIPRYNINNPAVRTTINTASC